MSQQLFFSAEVAGSRDRLGEFADGSLDVGRAGGGAVWWSITSGGDGNIGELVVKGEDVSNVHGRANSP